MKTIMVGEEIRSPLNQIKNKIKSMKVNNELKNVPYSKNIIQLLKKLEFILS